jgi:ABC-type transporter Mla MlaB component
MNVAQCKNQLSPMIRIELSEGLDVVTLALSGRIQAEDLPELKRVMESYSQPVVLNLTGVRLVDRATVGFLAEFEAKNGTIANCPGYIREWILGELTERS